MKNKTKNLVIAIIIATGLMLFSVGCAATCVTCNTCPNTVGMSGYH